jgi:hypothetical protein
MGQANSLSYFHLRLIPDLLYMGTGTSYNLKDIQLHNIPSLAKQGKKSRLISSPTASLTQSHSPNLFPSKITKQCPRFYHLPHLAPRPCGDWCRFFVPDNDVWDQVLKISMVQIRSLIFRTLPLFWLIPY